MSPTYIPLDQHNQPLTLCVLVFFSLWSAVTHHKKSSAGNILQCWDTYVKMIDRVILFYSSNPVPSWEYSPCTVLKKDHHPCVSVPTSRPSETIRQQGSRMVSIGRPNLTWVSSATETTVRSPNNTKWLENNRACVQHVTTQRVFQT